MLREGNATEQVKLVGESLTKQKLLLSNTMETSGLAE